MRSVWITLLLLGLASSARADAIVPFEGECPPGLQRAIVGHAEACAPIGCEDDRACGPGASCQSLCVCRAEREFTSDGRVMYPQPIRRVVEVGLCDAAGRCAEGDVAHRKQCEPNDATAAFDRARHAWTGRPYEPSGCSIALGSRSSGAWLSLLAISLLAISIVVRRRR